MMNDERGRTQKQKAESVLGLESKVLSQKVVESRGVPLARRKAELETTRRFETLKSGHADMLKVGLIRDA